MVYEVFLESCCDRKIVDSGSCDFFLSYGISNAVITLSANLVVAVNLNSV